VAAVGAVEPVGDALGKGALCDAVGELDAARQLERRGDVDGRHRASEVWRAEELLTLSLATAILTFVGVCKLFFLFLDDHF
jgi:hypothetical protein